MLDVEASAEVMWTHKEWWCQRGPGVLRLHGPSGLYTQEEAADDNRASRRSIEWLKAVRTLDAVPPSRPSPAARAGGG